MHGFHSSIRAFPPSVSWSTLVEACTFTWANNIESTHNQISPQMEYLSPSTRNMESRLQRNIIVLLHPFLGVSKPRRAKHRTDEARESESINHFVWTTPIIFHFANVLLGRKGQIRRCGLTMLRDDAPKVWWVCVSIPRFEVFYGLQPLHHSCTSLSSVQVCDLHIIIPCCCFSIWWGAASFVVIHVRLYTQHKELCGSSFSWCWVILLVCLNIIPKLSTCKEMLCGALPDLGCAIRLCAHEDCS